MCAQQYKIFLFYFNLIGAAETCGEGLRTQLQQEAERLASCITVSWSWELALIMAVLVLLLDWLLRPLLTRFTGRLYFLVT